MKNVVDLAYGPWTKSTSQPIMDSRAGAAAGLSGERSSMGYGHWELTVRWGKEREPWWFSFAPYWKQGGDVEVARQRRWLAAQRR
jgi:hypothetical protein